MSSYATHTDEALMDALHKDDSSAFEEIYNRYAAELYRHARRVVHNTEDCEEMLQDAFESLWRKRHTTHITALRAYLYKVIAFKVTDYLRKKSIHQRFVDHFRIFETVYDRADNREEVEKIFEAGLRQLPDRLQQVLRLRLSENLSNDEIALRLKVTTRTIETYMHQVYQHFRQTYPHMMKAKS
ncbi:MAG: sigma-70 family RNA polymerase sigma factor [Cyclobacteriaceae bacterium]|nr:sigma-70 family RNA polymerase sigma factor [Cyclobacteriaceae bacterium]